jgi:hypothetical protein
MAKHLGTTKAGGLKERNPATPAATQETGPRVVRDGLTTLSPTIVVAPVNVANPGDNRRPIIRNRASNLDFL